MQATTVGLVGAVGLLVVAGTSWGEPYFTGLGGPPVFHDTRPFALSADGEVVVGYGPTDQGFQAFKWTPTQGVMPLTDLTMPAESNQGWGVSGDGQVIVGGITSPSRQEAFRWTAGTGFVGLGDLDGGSDISTAVGVSADGSVVVGLGRSAEGYEAFRWTEADGMIGLGDLDGGEYYSYAYAASPDGSVIVGRSVNGEGSEAFRWTQTTGMKGLGELDGGGYGSGALAISADGLTIVGSSSSSSEGGAEAFRWTESLGMVSLNLSVDGFYAVEALGVSADGSVIVGRGDNGAFIWDATNGVRVLAAVLADEYGFNVAGWQLSEARAITPDGSTIVGLGRNPSGAVEGWYVRLRDPPEPLGLVSAVSRKQHPPGGAIVGDVDVLAGGVECRAGGLSTLVLGFDGVVRSTGLADVDCGHFVLSRGECTSVSGSGTDTLAVMIADVPADGCISVGIQNIKALNGGAFAGPNEIHVRTLLGDRNGDGVVNIVDLNEVKRSLFQPTPDTFRSDISVDGVINIADLNAVKGNLFATVSCPEGD